jgi:homoserine dehydrogenase
MSGSTSTQLHAPGNTTVAQREIRTLRVGLLGHGTVGRAFTELLRSRHEDVRTHHGLDLRVETILVRDASRVRPDLPAGARTVDTPHEFTTREHDVVVEALGGLEPARTLVERALSSGTPVVSANKALLAEHGDELLEAAHASGTALRAEAAVAAGVPLLGVLQTSLRGARIDRIDAILNGTSNHVLTHVDRTGGTVPDALEAARAAGYCEADASLDLAGTDAAHKLRILLASIDARPCLPEIRGVADVTPDEARVARRCGYVLRPAVHVAIGETTSAWIGPTAVPETHPLANVEGAGNAVALRGEPVGSVVLSGPGAGGPATASALLDDVLAVAEGGGSYARPRRGGEALRTSAPDSEWLVVLGPAPTGPDLDTLLDFVHGEGLAFRRLHHVELPSGPVLAGITRPASRALVERAVTTVLTVGAVRVGRAFRVLPTLS